jgi:hypothetical protein
MIDKTTTDCRLGVVIAGGAGVCKTQKALDPQSRCKHQILAFFKRPFEKCNRLKHINNRLRILSSLSLVSSLELAGVRLQQTQRTPSAMTTHGNDTTMQ